MATYRILFCASEAYPLIKTGGLADVAGSLPRALQHLRHDVHLVLPAYRAVMDQLRHPAHLRVETRVMGQAVRILQTLLPGSRVPVWLIDCPELFDRPGNPYHDEHGEAWPDNARRFAVFNRVIISLALNRCGLNWQPHVVHCHDWQTALVPALLETETRRPATLFTIHNLAYQGVFDRATFESLQLPEFFWHYERLEYHQHFAFIKGGLVFADRLNTVSPHYAEEIRTRAFGHGMEGVLQHRARRLSGIINGIDTRTWNPGTDEYLPYKYNRQHLPARAGNKRALQQRFGLPQDSEVMLLGLVSRLAEQKGIDLLLGVLPKLLRLPVQLAIVGSGHKAYEKALRQAAQAHPDKLAVHLGYDEGHAHLVEGGADAFLMPSRFEPCGLNQMYSQRYGALPIVAPVGGLVDTVVDASVENIAAATASGFIMTEVSEAGLLGAIERAMMLFTEKNTWQQLMRTGMKQDFSWNKSAEAYTALYAQALRDNPRPV